jgi:5-methyltetrahydrofolate--homocysteine methyltransferase
MEKVEGQEGKGKIVLATVKGDVHDIGKNLVDIILTNNGYTVINLGIKQPVNAILDAAQEHDADVIGMSGLLVKSTVVMKENLLEMNSRGISTDYPVILGGAALTRAYVEQDLDDVFDGEVKYARDAFEGLRLMDTLMATKRGEVTPEASAEAKAKDEERRARHARSRAIAESRREREEVPDEPVARSDVAVDNRIPEPPFWGSRVSKGSPWPTTRPGSTSGRCSSASGGFAAHAAVTARRTTSWSRPRAGLGCARCWPRCRPRGSCRPRSCTATSPAVSKGEDLIVWTHHR